MASANKFTIEISAVDKATAVFRKVNKAVNSLTRPFEEVGKSFKGMGKELGFQRLSKSLGNIGQHARDAASGVSSIVAPMAAITGIGTVAGMVALADSWAKMGRSTVYTAGNIGASAKEMQRLQGAAKLAGLSSEDVTGSLQGLSNMMENATHGRDNGAVVMFNRLTGGIKRTASGAMDVTGEFKAMATAIYKLKTPQEQMAVASRAGMASLLPMIRQGPAGYKALEDRAESLGLVMSGPALKAATDMANSLDNLQGAGTGLKNSIVEQLAPSIMPLTDGLAKWIEQNRTLISQDIGDWAKGFSEWIKKIDWQGVGNGITKFIKGIGNVVDHLGGWKNTAIALGIVMNASLIGSVLSLGVTLLRGGAGILAFTGLLTRWGLAATSAAGATTEAGVAADALAGGAAGGALLAGGVVAGSLALSGDQDQGAVDAQTLQNRAMAGDSAAAQQLAKQQLTHWWNPKPSAQEVDARAGDISSGKQEGISAAQMAVMHPDRAAAEKRLTDLEQKYNLPPGMMDRVWNQESSRGANMLSGKGAKGHFGFEDATAKQYGVTNPNDFNQSSDGSARMFRDLIKSNGGDLDRALAAYNWGQGKLNKNGLENAPTETKNYIRDVEGGLKPGDVPVTAPDAAQAPQGPYSAGTKAAAARHQLDVSFSGLPPGAQARVKSSTGGDITTKIGYSAVGGIV